MDIIRNCGTTAADWAAFVAAHPNYPLPNRVTFLETDTGLMKIGNGVDGWETLDYTAQTGPQGPQGAKGDTGEYANADTLIATSSSTVTIGTGSKAFTIEADKDFAPGMNIKVSRTASPATSYMYGVVDSYSGTTLVVTVESVGDDGQEYDAWTITFTAGNATGSVSIKSDNNDPIPAHTNLQIIGAGLVLTEDTTNDAWALSAPETKGIYGGVYPYKNTKLGCHVQAGRAHIATLSDPIEGNPQIGHSDYTDWQRSFSRIDYSWKLAAEMGVKWAHVAAEPLNAARLMTDTSTLSVAIVDSLLGTGAWDHVERDLQNCRKYGIKVDLFTSIVASGNTRAATLADAIHYSKIMNECLLTKFRGYADIFTLDPLAEFEYKVSVIGDVTHTPEGHVAAMIQWQTEVYDYLKALFPEVTICLGSGYGSVLTDVIQGLYDADPTDLKFDYAALVHLYPDYSVMTAPDWYEGVALGSSGTADIDAIIAQLDSIGRSDLGVMITEFGVFWNTRSTFSVTNGSTSVTSSDAYFRTNTVQSPALSNGDVIQFVPNFYDLPFEPPATKFTVSGISDTGFTISPAYSGTDLTGYKILNLTWQQNSADSLEQMNTWVDAQPRVYCAIRWAFWEIGYSAGATDVAHPPYFSAVVGYNGHGLINEYTGVMNIVGEKLMELTHADHVKHYSRIQLPNGPAANIPDTLPMAELAFESDTPNRLFIGIGEGETKLPITTKIYTSDDGLQSGINTPDPRATLHINSSDTYNVGTALYTGTKGLTVSGQGESTVVTLSNASNGAAVKNTLRAIQAAGTLANPTAPSAADFVFNFIGAIYDGTSVQSTAAIDFVVDGTVTAGNAPQRISFSTGTQSARYERLTVKSDGKVGIGTTSPTTALDVNGTVTATSFAGNGSALTNVALLPYAGIAAAAQAVIGYNNQRTAGGTATNTLPTPVDGKSLIFSNNSGVDITLSCAQNIRGGGAVGTSIVVANNTAYLFYAAGNSEWHGFGYSGSGGTTITGTATGALAYYTGSAWQDTDDGSGNDGLYWDGANNRLGIGTNAPGFPLHVVSSGAVKFRRDTTTTTNLVHTIFLSNFDSTTGNTIAIAYQGYNASSAETTFARTGIYLKDKTASSEDADYSIELVRGGTLTQAQRVTNTGVTQFNSAGMMFSGVTTQITNNTVEDCFTITLSDNECVGGFVVWQAYRDDGTTHAGTSGHFHFVAVNNGGTVTASIPATTAVSVAVNGTTATNATVSTGTNTATINMAGNHTVSSGTMKIAWTVILNSNLASSTYCPTVTAIA